MSEGEFTRWAVDVKALTEQEAAEWWTDFFDNPLVERDNAGSRGRLQLWIPKPKANIMQNETYTDSAVSEGSKAIKAPREKDVDMPKEHVKRQKVSYASEFLMGTHFGGSGVNTPSKRGLPDVEVTPAKRRAKEIELDREVPKLYTIMDKDLNTPRVTMGTSLKRVQAAKEAFGKYNIMDHACKDVALIAILKNIKFRAYMICAWHGLDASTCDILAPFKCVLDAPPADAPAAVVDMIRKEMEDWGTMAVGSLETVLENNKPRLPFVGRVSLFKPHAELEMQRASALSLQSADDFEETKLSWKSSMDACSAPGLSAAKVANDLLTHLKTREAETKRFALRQAQSKQQAQLRQVRDEAKKAAEDIKKKHRPVDQVLPVYTVDLTDVPVVKLHDGDLPADGFGWDEPFCWRGPELVQLCLGDEKLQKSFTSWANQYKRPCENNDGSGRHQYPLQTNYVRQGGCGVALRRHEGPGLGEHRQRQGRGLVHEILVAVRLRVRRRHEVHWLLPQQCGVLQGARVWGGDVLLPLCSVGHGSSGPG